MSQKLSRSSASGALDGDATAPAHMIDVLPSEIIAHILLLCIPHFRPFNYSTKAVIEVLRLGRISHFFRALVHSTPELWATVTFFVYHTDDFSRLTEWLDRAKESPLRIRIKTLRERQWVDDDEDNEDPVRRLMNVVKPYLGRCVDLDLMLPYPRPNILPQAYGELSSLKTLTIHVGRSLGETTFRLNLTPDTAPRLRELSLSRVWVKELSIPWNLLQIIHLDEVFPKEYIFVLRHAPNIIHISLSHIILDSVDSEFGTPRENLDIVLPHLRTIDWLAYAGPRLLPLFQLIVAPSLTTLRLAPPDRGLFHSPYIFSFLQSCRDTLALVIAMNLQDDEIVDLWARLPGVTVVGLPMWKDPAEQRDRPVLNDDIISLYNAPTSREWSKVTHFLPASRDGHDGYTIAM